MVPLSLTGLDMGVTREACFLDWRSPPPATVGECYGVKCERK